MRVLMEGIRGRRGLGPCAGGWNFWGPENVRCMKVVDERSRFLRALFFLMVGTCVS